MCKEVEKLAIERLYMLLRKNNSITQEEVADKDHINRSHYGFIENGQRSPSFEITQKFLV